MEETGRSISLQPLLGVFAQICLLSMVRPRPAPAMRDIAPPCTAREPRRRAYRTQRCVVQLSPVASRHFQFPNVFQKRQQASSTDLTNRASGIYSYPAAGPIRLR